MFDQSFTSSKMDSSDNKDGKQWVRMRSVIGGFAPDAASTSGYAAQSSQGSKMSMFSTSKSVTRILEKKALA